MMNNSIKFTKMHGLGNDYIYVDCLSQTIYDPSTLSVRLSDRHFGVGGDGLICISGSVNADFRMDIYNADGSQAEMCGNGIRCVGKFLYDRGLTNKTNLVIETQAGLRYLQLHTQQTHVISVTVDMGKPELNPEKIPVLLEKPSCIGEAINIGCALWHVTCISMGNPHAVVFVDDIEKVDLSSVGPLFENHTMFPNRINTEFVNIQDRHTISMRVWERGSGETLACGTGACASVV
ncbi:MAG: diaminopimelate epimerase, partial [Bacteroidales bacterium]|nr:diaminopimelate epimerase [Bacteroidales bacterium]